MCHAQRHGGPDDEGIYIDPVNQVGLGHRRLSLLDLSEAGHQPMYYQNDQLVICYNGELYNFLELKEELSFLGYQFRSSSDTEVILAAFAAWGTDAFKRFCGMFAFALYNRNTDKVYLVRDQSGIKPLYYSTHKRSLVFSSETRALHHVPHLQEENKDWPVHLLAYGHLPEPVTTLKHASPLPKGFFLEYDLHSKKATLESFSHFSFIEKQSNKADVLQQIRSVFEKAVQRHLLSDAPIGSFLSGGVDSSLLSIVASKYTKEHLNTLSIYFSEGAYSEKKYQDVVLDKLKCNHTGHLLTQEEFTNSLPAIISAMDLPSSDGINTWFISKIAKGAGLKAVLSGLGGDELFGGYPSFDRMKMVIYLQGMPNASLRAGRFSGLKQLKRLPYLSIPGIKGKYLFLRGQYIPSEIARQLNMDERQVWRILEDQPSLPDIHYLSQKNQASWMELNMYMQNQLLRDSDVMSMAHGIEIRVPFLDADFIRLALQISSPLKYAASGKQLLIDAFSDVLPQEIYKRPKMGFAFPFKEWMRNNPWIKEEMETGGKEARKAHALFLKDQRHWSQILTLLLTKNYQTEKTAMPVVA